MFGGVVAGGVVFGGDVAGGVVATVPPWRLLLPGATSVLPSVWIVGLVTPATACSVTLHCTSIDAEHRAGELVAAVGREVHAVAAAHVDQVPVGVGQSVGVLAVGVEEHRVVVDEDGVGVHGDHRIATGR